LVGEAVAHGVVGVGVFGTVGVVGPGEPVGVVVPVLVVAVLSADVGDVAGGAVLVVPLQDEAVILFPALDPPRAHQGIIAGLLDDAPGQGDLFGAVPLVGVPEI